MNFDDEDNTEITLLTNDSISVIYESFENNSSDPSLSLFKLPNTVFNSLKSLTIIIYFFN